MFAPKVAKAQTKETTRPTSKQAPQRSRLVEWSMGGRAVEQAQTVQQSIGNQATLRLLGRRPTSLMGSESRGHSDQGADAASLAAQEVSRGVSWDFSKIPVFSPGRANRPQARSSVTASPLPGFLQTKLAIGAVDDPLEHEADQVADVVMRMPDPERFVASAPIQISRKCANCEDDERRQLQTKPSGAPVVAGGEAPGPVHEVLRETGQPLDSGTRAFFESRFGHDFGTVRVHTGAKAAQSARALNALAYTVGTNIVFDTGQFNPALGQSRRLIAHELTHSIQQTGGPNTFRVHPSDSGTLRRYGHRDCTDTDLSSHLWPADAEARKMTANAIRVLSATPMPASVTSLCSKYFMTAAPDTAKILAIYQQVQDALTANDYIYECEEDCGGGDLGYVYGMWSHIHLCMNHIRTWSTACIARTIVHEFSHYYGGTKDKGYCKSGCGFAACPSSLSVADALTNADSFACFAYELYSTPPTPAPVPPPTPAPTPAPAPSAPARTYTVAEGDYLIKIASDLCGDASKWQDIYNSNRAVIGPDPDLIYPGQVLTIPCAAP